MDYKTYVSGLGIEEIITDLKSIKKNADDYQQEALLKMILAYQNALNGEPESQPLTEVLSFTLDQNLSENEKVNNVIRKHALVSMLMLLELSSNQKADDDLRSWLKSVVVTTSLETEGKKYETQTELNLSEIKEKAINKTEAKLEEIQEKLPEIEEQVVLDIPLTNRLNAKKWLDKNAPNNPKWSGYIGKKSLMSELEKIEQFDTDRIEQTFSNIQNTTRIMKAINTLISSHFEEVINGYREQLELEPILRKTTYLGAEEVAFYTALIENDYVDTISSTGKEVTIQYFSDSLFYKLAYPDKIFLEQATEFMLSIFISECKHIKNEKEDRYILTYHYDLTTKGGKE